jgi:hypothetical protein
VPGPGQRRTAAPSAWRHGPRACAGNPPSPLGTEARASLRAWPALAEAGNQARACGLQRRVDVSACATHCARISLPVSGAFARDYECARVLLCKQLRASLTLSALGSRSRLVFCLIGLVAFGHGAEAAVPKRR